MRIITWTMKKLKLKFKAEFIYGKLFGVEKRRKKKG